MAVSFYRVTLIDFDEHPDHPPTTVGVQATTAREAIATFLDQLYDEPDQPALERLVLTVQSDPDERPG